VNPLAISTGSLPPSATYARRDWVWVPADEHAPAGTVGALAIVQQRGARQGARAERDTYAVALDGDGYELANRATGTRYVCRPAAGKCSCPAGASGRNCKHLSALEALAIMGLI
jgi:hypothetical protein